MARVSSALLCLVFLVCGTCVYAAGPTAVVTIGNVEAQPGDTVVVPVTLATNGTQPGLVIFRIQYDPDRLTYVSADPGAAALAAGKEIDANLTVPGTLNIIVFGLTFDAIQNGVIVEVTFDLADSFTAGQASLAGSNISISSPIGAGISSAIVNGSVGIPCADVGEAQNVIASTGRTDGILVQWTAGQDATEYQVYRATSNNAAVADAIGGWNSELQYLDTTAQAPQSSSGCAGGQTNRVYYYWVRARNDAACEGALAGPAQGYRGKAASAGMADWTVISLGLFFALRRVRYQKTAGC